MSKNCISLNTNKEPLLMKEERIIDDIKRNDITFVHYIDINYRFSDNTLLIHKACLYNNLDLLLYHISKDVDLNIKGGRYNSTALYFTIYNHSHELTYVLCELGADITCVNDTKLNLFEVCIKFDNILGFILLFHYLPDNYNTEKIHLYALKKSKYRFLQVFRRLQKENKYADQLNRFNQQLALNRKENYILKMIRSIEDTRLYLLLFSILFCCYPNACVCLIIYLNIRNDRKQMKDKLFVYLNIFYTVHYVLKCITANLFTVLILIPYLLLFAKLLIHVPKCKQNSLSESKDIIKELLTQELYTMEHFCYICWIRKKKNTIHCHICEKCIDNYDHHCKFLGYCIDETTHAYFTVYIYLTMFLIMFTSYLDISKDVMIHYRLITVFLILQIFGRLTA